MTIFYGARDHDLVGVDPTWQGWPIEALKLALVAINAVAWALLLWAIL